MTTVHGEPFAIVPEWLLDSGTSDRAVRLFAILQRHADRAGYAWPRRRLLWERLGCSANTLDRAFLELQEAGALTAERRYRDDGSQASNAYWLWPATPPTLPLEVPTGGGTPPHPWGGGVPTHGDP